MLWLKLVLQLDGMKPGAFFQLPAVLALQPCNVLEQMRTES
jgi:hypothetical protein